MNRDIVPTQERVQEVEIWISNLLRGGVLLSLGLLVLGTVLTFLHHPAYRGDAHSLQQLTGEGALFPHTLLDLGIALHERKGRGVVVLGLLVLIATPILRVAVSCLVFWRERDKAFTVITLGVLGLLLVSLVLGRAGG